MKVGIVGQFGTESLGLHIKENLTNMGHDVVSCVSFFPENKGKRKAKRALFDKIYRAFNDKLRFTNKKCRDFVMGRVIQQICSNELDLIICTKDYFLDYEIEKIRTKTGAKIVMWYPDHLMNFGNAAFINAGYDAMFFKDPFIVRNLREVYEIKAYYLPECFSPIRHQRVSYNANDEKAYQCEISAIGNIHTFRANILQKLVNYDLKIYGLSGPWWLNTCKLKNSYTGRYLAYTDKAKAIRYSKININTLYFGEIEGVNVRAFELAGMGGFQILQNKPGINQLFEIGKEVVTYNSMNELREKIDYYLHHNEEREEIANNGYERALLCHTYEKRLTRMINITFSKDITYEESYDYLALS